MLKSLNFQSCYFRGLGKFLGSFFYFLRERKKEKGKSNEKKKKSQKVIVLLQDPRKIWQCAVMSPFQCILGSYSAVKFFCINSVNEILNFLKHIPIFITPGFFVGLALYRTSMNYLIECECHVTSNEMVGIDPIRCLTSKESVLMFIRN